MRKLLLLSFGAILFAFFIAGCEKDNKSDEVCLQEEYKECSDIATYCCEGEGSEEVCVWKYNGQEFADTDTGVDALYQAMECTQVSIALDLKSGVDELSEFQSFLENIRIKMRGLKN